jgi:hypothetical protein
LKLSYPKTQLTYPEKVFIEKKRNRFPLKLRVKEGPEIDEVLIRQPQYPSHNEIPVMGEIRSICESENIYCTDAGCLGSRPTGTSSQGSGIIRAGPVLISEPRTVCLEYKGYLRLGDTTGELLIEAPGVSPIPISYTVRYRWPEYLIVVFAFIGIFIGYVMRVLFVNWRERKRVKDQLTELLKRIDEAKQIPGLPQDKMKQLIAWITELKGQIDKIDNEGFFGDPDWEGIKKTINNIQKEFNELLAGITPALKMLEIRHLLEPYILATKPKKLREIFVIELVEVVFSAVALSLLAYPIYRNHFIGGFADCLMVASYGFTADVSIGGVVARMRTWLGQGPRN